ncbi:hypothetical protein [Thiocystis violascens]|uniref:Uncharacterized protein n=1 Tax=Thiocystis violascens (strain ATCC 17096 / DSM 198 / 6111) TaxID=765911 RepID=I3Y998_THIV6|nr:hypothetical protein [Thiocystis violascens]AFL73566.1 hypothetical protein Thivi_1578 [Thiocystis violascens DSM 198]
MTIRRRIEVLEKAEQPDEAMVSFFGLEVRRSAIREAIRTIWRRPPSGLPDPGEMAAHEAEGRER